MGFWSFLPHRLPWYRRVLNRLIHHSRRRPTVSIQIITLIIILFSLTLSISLKLSLDARRLARLPFAQTMLVEFIQNPQTGTVSINRAARVPDTATLNQPLQTNPSAAISTLEVTTNGRVTNTVPLSFISTVHADNFDLLADSTLPITSHQPEFPLAQPYALALISYTPSTALTITKPGRSPQTLDSAPLTLTANQPLSDTPTIDSSQPTAPFPDNTLDILFISDSYTDFTQFHQDAQTMHDLLTSLTPFSEFISSIQPHFLDNVTDLGCYRPPSIPRLIVCDAYKVYLAASTMNYDTLVVVHNSNEYGGSGSPGLAVTYRDVTSLGAKVMVHEFGHSFGGLGDEYSYDSIYYGIPYWPNCDLSSCPKWSANPDTGCFSVCGYTNLYRPTDNDSLMRSLSPAHGFRFGPVSEDHLRSLIRSYIPAADPDLDGDFDFLDYQLILNDFPTHTLFDLNQLINYY